MSDSERLDRYLEDFGDRLAAAAPRGRHRRRRRPIALALAIAVVAIVAVVFVSSDDRRLDPVAEARAALARPGEIVYMKITSTFRAPGIGSVPAPQTTEQWSALDPPRWRFVQHIPRSGSRVTAGSGNRVVTPTGRRELSYAHGVTRSYDADRDSITVTRGYSDRSDAARLPSVLGQGTGDPAVDLRSMLLRGTVSDRGRQRLRGRTVHRFVIEQRQAPSGKRAGTVRRMVYDVDPRTFAPIEGRFSFTLESGPIRRMTSRMHVDVYRRIPLTPTTAKLLRIGTTAQTTATFDTAQKLRARLQAWRARCRPIRNGRALACPPPPGQRSP